MFIEINGIKVNYIDCGAGESPLKTEKPTALVLHGWGCNVSVYSGITEQISEYCRVILPELPGFGKTPEPPEVWGVSDYADFVIDFCKASGLEPSIIIAHSLGCRIATKILSENRLAPLKVVYTGAAGIKPKRTTAQKVKTALFKTKKLFLKPFPQQVEKMRQKYGSEDYRTASPVMRASLVKIVNEDLTERLPRIKQEVLLIWGENDDSTPLSDGRLMEKLIENAGLAIIKNAGHYAFLEHPALFNRILDSFLNSSSGGKND
ncbi:MAG: alpha/beta hydrolase [Oscillospiraceae bacterium]|nr:alpha/beta hydrolase [Oscillospiraceae bacterium]